MSFRRAKLRLGTTPFPAGDTASDILLARIPSPHIRTITTA